MIGLAVAKPQSETRPGATVALQADPAPTAASGRPMTPSAKVPVAGVIVLQDGALANGRTSAFTPRAITPTVFGEVRADTNADAQGRFALDVPPVEGAMAGVSRVWNALGVPAGRTRRVHSRSSRCPACWLAPAARDRAAGPSDFRDPSPGRHSGRWRTDRTPRSESSGLAPCRMASRL